MENLDTWKRRIEVELDEEWKDWLSEIPSLSFPKEWDIRVLPPFGGALIRFWVFKEGNWVSVYLDVFGRLAPLDTPYLEIYPNFFGRTERFKMHDTENLLIAIERSLNRPKEE